MARIRGIYETQGKAREFNRWGLSLGRGCVHGCVYCWVPRILRMPREEFHARFEPKDEKALLEAVRRDAVRLLNACGGDPEPVLMCFSCDPMQPGAWPLAYRVAVTLNNFSVPAAILTKAGPVPPGFFPEFARNPRNEFAVTLTLDNEQDSRRWEPRAGLPQSRIDNLLKACSAGARTWASLEPVIEPAQTLTLARMAAPFVTHFKAGTLNYHPHADKVSREYGWGRFLAEIEELADREGVGLVVKESLRKAVGRE